MLKEYEGESFVQFLSSWSCNAARSNDYFKNFGFRKRPRRGSSFRRFVDPVKLQKEDFLIRELFASALSTALLCLPEIYTNEFKAKVAARVLENVICSPDIYKAFAFDTLEEALAYMGNCVSDYLKRKDDTDNLSHVFNEHAMTVLDKNYTPAFMAWSTVQFTDGFFKIKVYIKNEVQHPIPDNIVFCNERIRNYIHI